MVGACLLVDDHREIRIRCVDGRASPRAVTLRRQLDRRQQSSSTVDRS
eukprot:SAG31_NODE_6045_length_2193_cov_0.862942_1_plen_47_part_10